MSEMSNGQSVGGEWLDLSHGSRLICDDQFRMSGRRQAW
jgi:hypothetical protein